MILSKSVSRITVTSPDKDPRVVVTSTTGSSQVLRLPSIDTFEDELDALQDDQTAAVIVDYRHGVPVASRVAHAAFIVGGFAILLRIFGREPAALQQMRGLLGPKEHKFEVVRGHTTKFSDVAGCTEAKVEIMEIVDFLKDRSKYEALGARIPRGALLVGPPGTGKTLLAKATAAESGVPFINCAGSDFVEMIVGVGPKRVRELFTLARKVAPCIVFIDEIDAVGRQRGEGAKLGMRNDERENTLNQLLVELDGFESSSGVVVLAGTNRVDILDKALKRPGRFDRQISLPLPALTDREAIFKIHLAKVKLLPTESVDDLATRLAALTPGMSGADIANVANLGALTAARHGAKEGVGMEDFTYAIERVLAGSAKDDRVLAVDEKRRVAAHSAAQVVYQWLSPYSDPVLRVSIIPRGGERIGFTQILPKERFINTKAAIFDKMVARLVGVIAEREIVGGRSTRAHKALEGVTNDAISWSCVYGFSWDVGHVHFTGLDEQRATAPYSESTQRLVDSVTGHLVDAAYRAAEEAFARQREQVVAVCDALMAKEVLSDLDLKAILSDRPPLLAEMAGDAIPTFGPAEYAAHLAHWRTARAAEAGAVRAALRELAAAGDRADAAGTSLSQLGGGGVTVEDMSVAVAAERERTARRTAADDAAAWLAASAACETVPALAAAMSTLASASAHSAASAAALCAAAASAGTALPPAACVLLAARLHEWAATDVAGCGAAAAAAAARLDASALAALAAYAAAGAALAGVRGGAAAAAAAATAAAAARAHPAADAHTASADGASDAAASASATVTSCAPVPTTAASLAAGAAAVATAAGLSGRPIAPALAAAIAAVVTACAPTVTAVTDALQRAPTDDARGHVSSLSSALVQSVGALAALHTCAAAAPSTVKSWATAAVLAVEAVFATMRAPGVLPSDAAAPGGALVLLLPPHDGAGALRAAVAFDALLAAARLAVAAVADLPAVVPTLSSPSVGSSAGDAAPAAVSRDEADARALQPAAEVVRGAFVALHSAGQSGVPLAATALSPAAAVTTAQLLAAARVLDEGVVAALSDAVGRVSATLSTAQLAGLLEALATVGAVEPLLVVDAARAVADRVPTMSPDHAAGMLWSAAVLRATCDADGADAGLLEPVSSLVSRLTQRIATVAPASLSRTSASRIYVAFALTADLVGGLSLPAPLVAEVRAAWAEQQAAAPVPDTAAASAGAEEPQAGMSPTWATARRDMMSSAETAAVIDASLVRLDAQRARGAATPWAPVVDWRGQPVAVVAVGKEHVLASPPRAVDGETRALALFLERRGWLVATLHAARLGEAAAEGGDATVDEVVREALDAAVSGGR